MTPEQLTTQFIQMKSDMSSITATVESILSRLEEGHADMKDISKNLIGVDETLKQHIAEENALLSQIKASSKIYMLFISLLITCVFGALGLLYKHIAG